MTKLSEILPTESQTVQAIYEHYQKVGGSEPGRGYLGASIIGHSCERLLWYTFRACYESRPSGRLYRLFETGQREEARICDNLRAIGCEVWDVDDQGQQFAVEWFGGHFGGHLDGVVKGIPEAPQTVHVLECKTHNDKSFTKLKKEGVQKSKPQHFAQMQIYMLGTKLDRALYFAVNKNTDEIYTERVKLDKECANKLLERAKRVITATEPPPRISERPDYYECRFCDAHEICWGSEKVLPLPQVSCKQCCYATPVLEDKANLAPWKCERCGVVGVPTKPCPDHLCLPGLFPYAEPVDFTDGMICFKNTDDGKQWQHGGFCHTTEELVKMNRSEL